jgi:hypothetical protein
MVDASQTQLIMPDRPITGASAWYGKDMKKSRQWLFQLLDRDVEEIEAAVSASMECRIKDIDKARFPLPTLGPRLDDLLTELLEGRGFVLIRGLPMDKYDFETAARAYWGLGRHLGEPTSQNANGDLLGHVIDLSRPADDPNVRLYQTSARQNYHTDPSDIVGLLCWRKSMSGGASSILSSVTVYNEMYRRRPDLARELFAPFHVDRRGENPAGKNPWYEMPVFSWYDGLLTTGFTRPYIDSGQRFPEVPRLTAIQIEALDLFQSLCEDPDLHLIINFEPGDIQLLHNYQILHDRTAFQDWPDPEQKRHLLRLWLCPPRGRELAPVYLDRQESIDVGNRGAVVVPGTKQDVRLGGCSEFRVTGIV